MGYFFLFDGDGQATQLIKYEASLSPKIEDNNARALAATTQETIKILMIVRKRSFFLKERRSCLKSKKTQLNL